MEITVWRETPRTLANSACDISRRVRSSWTRFPTKWGYLYFGPISRELYTRRACSNAWGYGSAGVRDDAELGAFRIGDYDDRALVVVVPLAGLKADRSPTGARGEATQASTHAPRYRATLPRTHQSAPRPCSQS